MMTVKDILRATRGTLHCAQAETILTGVSIDSRTIKKGNVFIAIQGAKFDGHEFIRAALKQGASALVVSRDVPCSGEIAVVRVKDTTKALGQIAAWHRRQFSIPVIAVTGSAGKTTTKELMAAVLGTRWNVLKTVKTENNQYGVPLTVLKLNASHQMAVLELGTNHPGEIRWLTQIAQPTVAVFTNIGESHLEGLKSPLGVFREKIQLLRALGDQGVIILNQDDQYLSAITRKHPGQRILRFGLSAGADIRAHGLTVRRNSQLQFTAQGHKFIIKTPAEHNVYNALAAISCGEVFKIGYNDVFAALAKFRFSGARQEISKAGDLLVIDDTYNANPISLKSAVNTLSGLRIKGKRIVVCADMLELGQRSKALHQSAGKMIGQSSTDVVLTVGPFARYIAEEVNQFRKNIAAVHCQDLSDVHHYLKEFCRPGDAVLVKGSRGMHMERTVSFLKEELTRIT